MIPSVRPPGCVAVVRQAQAPLACDVSEQVATRPVRVPLAATVIACDASVQVGTARIRVPLALPQPLPLACDESVWAVTVRARVTQPGAVRTACGVSAEVARVAPVLCCSRRYPRRPALLLPRETCRPQATSHRPVARPTSAGHWHGLLPPCRHGHCPLLLLTLRLVSRRCLPLQLLLLLVLGVRHGVAGQLLAGRPPVRPVACAARAHRPAQQPDCSRDRAQYRCYVHVLAVDAAAAWQRSESAERLHDVAPLAVVVAGVEQVKPCRLQQKCGGQQQHCGGWSRRAHARPPRPVRVRVAGLPFAGRVRGLAAAPLRACASGSLVPKGW